MILSFKKFDNLLLYLSLKVGVNFMNSQDLKEHSTFFECVCIYKKSGVFL